MSNFTLKSFSQKQAFKHKHSCIKPEDCDITKYYTFSFNPVEQPEFVSFYKTHLNSLKDWSDNIKTNLLKLHFCKYHLACEISTGGRLHYHGYIRITNIVKFYLQDLAYLKTLGTFEIDKITDNIKWDTYVYKQKIFMEPYCQTEDITYELTNEQ